MCITFGETDTGLYLLDLWKHKVEFLDLKGMVTSLAATWPPTPCWSRTRQTVSA